jgi:hypothetical protein
MHLSGLRTVLLATAAAQVANAHTAFTNFFIDDVPQGDGTCVRMSDNIDKATSPIRPIGAVTGNDMACGKLIILPFNLHQICPHWLHQRAHVMHRCQWPERCSACLPREGRIKADLRMA